jgi:hypothetical protein
MRCVAEFVARDRPIEPEKHCSVRVTPRPSTTAEIGTSNNTLRQY